MDKDNNYLDLAKVRVVAFLHLVSRSSERSVSMQQSLLFIFIDINLIIVDWLRLGPLVCVYFPEHQEAPLCICI